MVPGISGSMVKRSPSKTNLLKYIIVCFKRYTNLQSTFAYAYLQIVFFFTYKHKYSTTYLMGIPSDLQAFGHRIGRIQLLIWWWQQMEVIHPGGNMNVCTKFLSAPSGSCPVLTLWRCYRQCHRITKVIRTCAMGTMNAWTNVHGNW